MINFNSTSIGYSHIIKNKPCQDFSAVFCSAAANIICVADGHGADAYFRSAKGSRFAAEVALVAVREFVLRFLPFKNRSSDDINFQITQLEKCIISRWGDKVYEDFLYFPFSEEEMAKIPPADDYEEMIYSTYGTTLLCCAVTENYWFAFQIGDGKIAALSKGGGWNEPVPWDDRCFLNATTSICDHDAISEFRHYYSEDIPAAVFLCTDGASDSYAKPEDLYKLYERILTIKPLDETHIINWLQNLLPKLSEAGSGDDISIAGIINEKDVKTALNPHINV
ncbi:MAG: protein phosphatase 2C domain-containing protein [Ruminococcus sp.]|jgi:serine/threonine protein phosphatase PrpC|nr:protein phosphatase 2C domain-containing protein [Ruminococcus sp.]